MSNEQKKPWFKSTTIIGIIIAASPTIARFFGYEIDPQTTLELKGLLTIGAESIEGAVTAAGSLLGLVGRIKATKKLSAK